MLWPSILVTIALIFPPGSLEAEASSKTARQEGCRKDTKAAGSRAKVESEGRTRQECFGGEQAKAVRSRADAESKPVILNNVAGLARRTSIKQPRKKLLRKWKRAVKKAWSGRDKENDAHLEKAYRNLNSREDLAGDLPLGTRRRVKQLNQRLRYSS